LQVAELFQLRHREVVLDEVRHLEAGRGAEILRRLPGAFFREVLLAGVEQRLREDLALAVLVVLGCHCIHQLRLGDLPLE